MNCPPGERRRRPFFLRGLDRISGIDSFQTENCTLILKSAPVPSRPSPQGSIYSRPGSGTNMVLTCSFHLFSLPDPVCSTNKVYLKSVHLAPSPLPSLRHHWSNVYANWKKEPFGQMLGLISSPLAIFVQHVISQTLHGGLEPQPKPWCPVVIASLFCPHPVLSLPIHSPHNSGTTFKSPRSLQSLLTLQ